MPNPIVIDKAHARRFLLGHLRLLPPRQLHGKQGMLDYFRNLALSLNLAFVWKRYFKR